MRILRKMDDVKEQAPAGEKIDYRTGKYYLCDNLKPAKNVFGPPENVLCVLNKPMRVPISFMRIKNLMTSGLSAL